MKRSLLLVLLALLLATVALASLGVGRYPVSPARIASFLLQELSGRGNLDREQLLMLENLVVEIRLPRVMAAALIGAGLSVSGATYQAMFVNPLVSPGILGVLAGASFGAALGMVLFHSWWAVQVLTFLGGFAGMATAVGVSLVYRVNSALMLVLGGVISGAFFTSLLSIVKFAADPYNQLPAIVYWLMGNMSAVDRSQVSTVAVPMVLGLLCLLSMARNLNALSMGDDEARSLGINVTRVRFTLIGTATLVSTLTVVIAGTIGWVGLIIPHVTRMIFGPDNEILLPASALLGASYLLAVDDVSRLVFPFEIPIGIFTALVGIPFFVLLVRNARRGWQ